MLRDLRASNVQRSGRPRSPVCGRAHRKGGPPVQETVRPCSPRGGGVLA